MTSPPATHEPLSRTARATRTRILEAALRELGRNADSRLGDIAEAAGVARRTVYAHFAGRAALVGGLAADAGEAIRVAIAVVDASASAPDADAGSAVGSASDAARSRGPAPGAASALARVVLTLWPVGDRYRTLIGLARRDLGANEFSELLTPVRDTVAGILARGQRQGVFRTGVPPGPLSRALEAHILVLLDSVNSGIWADDGTGAATTTLIAAGADREVAASTVRRLRDADQPGCDAR
ncbi:TetR family transcriptional regulator [Streptomyces sp. ActVer]|uniref:TetR family transcriptional regulator n=1 Tax=Streptomyces sp. ActVer TaxID=3014558 RepID=UPI0022B36408|nr:TetR family transcriptional regulator [Streptomyces sp. ActVer]MCZ4513448.1 TetR family transcriptional regulator [Streptomyces sp. ActVer]